ncbi:G-protein coupled receptor Mth2-like isoform X5 [Coccinella septempunctata]|uniref:G-protein coupled receptor Mth2-like isoform X5 n=1 Tax=Coccinella septempunctata TaxID=41139 RepID=UPI001D05E92A|nr:G-protein coupled receptor Mth2-like isoform X5 [Coccinella septempunctata]
MLRELLILSVFFGSVICGATVRTIISDDDEACRNAACIRKCCPEDQIYFRRKCINSTGLGFPIKVYDGQEEKTSGEVVFNLIHEKHCEEGIDIRLEPNSFEEDAFFVQSDGSMLMPILELTVPYNMYCLEHFKLSPNDTVTEFSALRCDDSIELDNPESKVYSQGMIISMPFLLVTFLVYALLPDRNLHMKALMCYVINLLHAYIFLVTIQLTDEVFEDTVCAILGYCCVFFFLASFFWMNVICVDIFLGFRGFRGVPGVRSSERKRFILYCIYAWGMSLLIVFITFMVNHFGNVGQWFYPGVAVGQCFIRNGIPQLLYFYGPMGIIIILNVVLFTLTAMRIRRVKKDTAMLKHSESKRHSDDDQQNFNLYLKLLLAMGVNWSMELVSWAVNLNNKAVPQYVWYLSDFCNATYGVFIFFIFVFKRNIWKQLRRRYYSFMGRHHMAHSMGTTNFTKTTNDSMTVSTNDRALEESELNGTRIN